MAKISTEIMNFNKFFCAVSKPVEYDELKW